MKRLALFAAAVVVFAFAGLARATDPCAVPVVAPVVQYQAAVAVPVVVQQFYAVPFVQAVQAVKVQAVKVQQVKVQAVKVQPVRQRIVARLRAY